MLISDGWAAPFQRLTADTPVVARMFSQNLYDRWSKESLEAGKNRLAGDTPASIAAASLDRPAAIAAQNRRRFSR